MQITTVSQVNSYIKSVLDSNEILKNIYVVGEISNFKDYNGNLYLTLKDEKTTLKAVMFSSYSSKLKFDINNGMSVICRGTVSVYDKIGTYQLYIYDMQPDGVGALSIAFEQLKAKLNDEGLFLEEHKKSIPKYPKKIGVATSNKGAAVEDVKKILKRRFPISEVVVVPTIVQGDLAPKDIADSVNYLNSIGDIDVIIVGRGGGSIEDLWAFNTEIVARAVYNSNVPIVSAVGHETDFTICDFVADFRAATPSAAAELVVPDMYMELVNIANLKNLLNSNINYKISNYRQNLDNLSNSNYLTDFQSIIDSTKEKIENYKIKMKTTIESNVNHQRQLFSAKCSMLNSLSPLSVLSRGYSIAFKEDVALKTVNGVNKDDNIVVKLKDGTINCTVNGVKNNE